MPIKILPMTSLDLPALAAIEEACFDTPWSHAALAAELAKDTAVFLVAHLADEIAGYVGMNYTLDEGYIANIAVKPTCRHRGVARALLTQLQAHSQAIGLAFLSLEVRPSNAAAIALYTEFGFEPVGRRKHFYSAPREDALILTRWLR